MRYMFSANLDVTADEEEDAVAFAKKLEETVKGVIENHPRLSDVGVYEVSFAINFVDPARFARGDPQLAPAIARGAILGQFEAPGADGLPGLRLSPLVVACRSGDLNPDGLCAH
jgi:hypothetical protein